MESSDEHRFSEKERSGLMAAIEASLRPLATADDFRQFIRINVKPLIPHGMMIAAVGRVTYDALRIEHVVGVDYPQQFLEQIRQDTSLAEHRVVAHWLRSRKPLLLDPAKGGDLMTKKARREIELFKLGQLAIHGHLDTTGRTGSYYSFARVSALTERHARLLQVLAPHIHVALMKVIPNTIGVVAAEVSRKEMELLRWLAHGKSNREIAVILHKSELTVRNQLHTLFGKLGVQSRAEAVARADALGLLGPRKMQ